MANIPHDRLPCGFSESDLIAEALGETPPQTQQKVQAHTAECLSCTRLLEQYQSLQTELQAVSVQPGEKEGLQQARRVLDTQLAQRQDHVHPRLTLKTWHSPIGDIRVGTTNKGVVLVEFVRPDEPAVATRFQQHFTVHDSGPETTHLIQQLDEYFHGQRQQFDWTVDDTFMRSDFQREVLQATAEIPYGTVVTYQGIANMIAQPKAVRAVAQALRHNPIPIHIPCHRVLGSDGRLTGYAGNLVDLKQRILETEGIPVVATSKGPAIAKKHMYVGWRLSNRFCRPDCRTLAGLQVSERVLIPSQARAQELGYAPCDTCRPQLYPLDKENSLWLDA